MTTRCNRDMPAPTENKVKAQILAKLRVGEKKAQIARDLGVSRDTVIRIDKERLAAGDDTIATASALEAQARQEIVSEIKQSFEEITTLAVARIKDCLTPPEDLTGDDLLAAIAMRTNPVVLQTSRWAIDKLVASADAKEQSRSASSNATAYAAMLARVTSSPDESRQRMLKGIEEAQDEVVAARRPFIVNPPDSASA